MDCGIECHLLHIELPALEAARGNLSISNLPPCSLRILKVRTCESEYVNTSSVQVAHIMWGVWDNVGTQQKWTCHWSHFGEVTCLHSNLHNITLVASKVHVILRSFVVLTWMSDEEELLLHVTLCNYNDDNVMRASVWFEFFDDLFWCRNPWFMGGNCDNKEWDSNWEYLYLRDLG